ncbi:MAG TPA: ABC transporter permease [Syntrophales bacterium]|jgi:molybdate transport system permease protein|nr:ABC transporter permease [Syntrophales bacterium]HON22424.1 ABC transporter permease [Syntrophales bacterium]HOU77547.1 ABC transporter permease [Syntrophales bacterium]HPC31474.1 ABC transporter permease [Syntrophales bacterium]HQG35136.1 ABC transporter permease [Syntrophales bacterium]
MSFRRLTISLAVFVFLVYVGLILSLFYFYRGPLFIKTLFSERTLYAVGLSLTTATVVTCFSIFFAVPSAYALSRYRFVGRKIVDTLLELPMIVSPVALGAMLLLFFITPAGQFIQERGTQFVFTVYGILLAQFVTTVGISIRLIKAVLDEIPQKYEEMAWVLGRSPANTFFTVVLPLSKKGIASAAVLTWAKALGEFGATITIAGSMAMKTETLPIAIFMRLANADIEGTVVLVLILIGMALGILYGVRLLLN